MSASYEAFIKARLPRWLQGTWGDAFSSVVGGMFDALLVAAKDAAKLGLVADCDVTALDHHGRDRLLERIDGETDEAYRLRILGAWDFWSGLASTESLRDAMRLYTGLAALEVYSFNGDASSPRWSDGNIGPYDDDDENDPNWSRNMVVIPQPHPWTRPVVGPDLVVGPGLMVGLTMTQSELQRIRRSYRKHRPAHMIGTLIYVIMDSTTAQDLVDDHEATADLVKLPLHATLVGYSPCGTVGQLIVGYVFT